MAGGGSKKEKRRAKKEEKKAKKGNHLKITIRECSRSEIEGLLPEGAPTEEDYQDMNETMNEIPVMGRMFDGLIRNCIRLTTQSWTSRFSKLPSLPGKNLVWLQLLVVDNQKATQVKLYALGARVACDENDSNVVERSRQLFKDAAPCFMKDDLCIFSRSLVQREYNGVVDDNALDFAAYDPLDALSKFPTDESSGGIRCAEIFLFFAVDHDVPEDDLGSREAVMAFLEGLNCEDGTRKIHVFTVTAGSVVATREKLDEITGGHVTA